MKKITGSIVLFKNEKEIVLEAIESFLKINLPSKLYVIDNSPTDSLRTINASPRIEYVHNPSNPGYGTAHNIAIRMAIEEDSDYHLVLNPDILFSEGTVEDLYSYMETNCEVGQIMPKVYYENGSIQRLCKLLPSPLDLFGRRFFKGTKWAKDRNEKYELHNFDYNSVLNTPCLSGCFMFLRISVLEQVGLFDERYFMYLEDYDLTRRIHKVANTVFYPEVSIVHGYQNESYKSKRLLRIHLQSAVKYFNKWGWFLDRERSVLNKKVLEQIKTYKKETDLTISQ